MPPDCTHGQASGAEVVAPALMRPILVAVTLSMFATPGLVALGAALDRRIGARQLRREEGSELPEERRGRVVIVGMGRVGRLVADLLDERGVPWTAVDRDPRAVSAERRRGRFIHFGDGSKIELLERIGLADAPALVVTMDAPEGVEAVVGTARHHHPDLVIVARARDDRHAARLYRLGATSAIPEAFEASLQLSEALLLDLGEPKDAVSELMRARRRAFRDSISASNTSG